MFAAETLKIQSHNSLALKKHHLTRWSRDLVSKSCNQQRATRLDVTLRRFPWSISRKMLQLLGTIGAITNNAKPACRSHGHPDLFPCSEDSDEDYWSGRYRRAGSVSLRLGSQRLGGPFGIKKVHAHKKDWRQLKCWRTPSSLTPRILVAKLQARFARPSQALHYPREAVTSHKINCCIVTEKHYKMPIFCNQNEKCRVALLISAGSKQI